MTAQKLTDGWSVADEDGGRWWPSQEAAEQIDAATDSAAEALRICEEEPMRGKWKQ